MGFNLGLAAAAYQGMKAEQRRLRDDDFKRAQNDYELAKMEEYQSRRGHRDNAADGENERVTAERGLLSKRTKAAELRLDGDLTNIPKQTTVAGLQLDGQARTVPLQTEATVGGLNATIKDQAFGESLRPVREKTERAKAQTGLVNADIAHEDALDVRAWGPVKRMENALKIDHAIAEMPEKRAQFQNNILAGIYAAGDRDGMEEQAIIARINATTGSKLFEELHGKTVADIKLENGNAELYDAEGTLIMSIPQQRMKAAYDAKNPSEVKTLADGTNLYSIAPGGRAATPLTNNKKSFNPNTGLGGAGRAARATQLENFANDLIAEAKAQGKTLSPAQAKRNALAEMKSNPAKSAERMLASNILYQAEDDPDKREAMKATAMQTAMELAAEAAGRKPEAPGLSNVSPETAAKVTAFAK